MDVYTLLSTGVSVKQHINNGHKALQRYIHRFPDNWRSWELMARLLLTEVNNMESDVAYSAAAWAWMLYESDERNLITNYHRYGKTLKQCAGDRWKVAKTLAYSTLACGKHSSIPGDMDALKAAQRLVHSHPYNAESWSILSSACHARTVYTKITKNETVLNNECRRFSEFVANHSSDKLHAWATKQNMLSCIIDHKHEAVAELASKITINFEESDVFVSLSECDVALHQSQEVEGHVIDELENLAFSQSTSLLSKKMISSALQCMGMYERSHKVLVNLLKTEPNNRFNILLRIAHLGLTAAATGCDITKWIDVATNASIGAVKLNGESPVALLLDALCHKANKNNKKMKSSLHKALTTTPHPMCQAKLLSSCLLYNFYQQQNDDVALQKLVEDLKGFGTGFWEKMQEILLTN
uniref:Uncharacterized protein n=1 Tax=Ciona savignyi TaxID=51511 RepID=H2YUN3_CIOSA